jgi:hypothetical protein
MRSAAETFELLGRMHACLYDELKKSKARGDYEMNHVNSSKMIMLRDIGRFILRWDPEDDANPFGGPDDY